MISFREIIILIGFLLTMIMRGRSGTVLPVFLYSTPEETLEHRRSRARDKGVDSPFTNVVLELKQEKLYLQAEKAALIITKNGELITYKQFLEKNR